MKGKKQKTSQVEVPEKRPIQKAISIATVVASLGTSLGVCVTDLIAAERKTPASKATTEQKTSLSADWENINSHQARLSDEIKLTEANQIKLVNQVKLEMKQGKFDVRQHKDLLSDRQKIDGQLRRLHADEIKISEQIKILQTKWEKLPGAIQGKILVLESKESKLVKEIKHLEANEARLSEQLKSHR